MKDIHTQTKILIVDDSPSMVEVIKASLDTQKYMTSVAETGQHGLDMIHAEEPDIVLLDLNLPDIHGLDILKTIRQNKKDCAVIVITGETAPQTIVNAMQLGANDFISKPFSAERLTVSIDNALQTRDLQRIAKSYQKIARSEFCNFIGHSPEMQELYYVIENAAPSTAPIFITGESGTGKELAAHAIHNLSTRANAPLEILNCASIPDNLLESEIFGHKKGAFTGAIENRIGAAERAHGGTLFLDELGEMPIALQSKLLRFVQTGSFMPVGGTKDKHANIRFISATNRNPQQAITAGQLREDLYYRLNVIPIHIQPLRKRHNDISLLAQHFLEQFSRLEKKSFLRIAPETESLLRSLPWPGNVRQLENTIRHAVVMHNGETLMPNMIPDSTLPNTTETSHSTPEKQSFLPENSAQIQSLKTYERSIIEAAIKACHGNITNAARRLEINPVTIHRKIKSWKNENS